MRGHQGLHQYQEAAHHEVSSRLGEADQGTEQGLRGDGDGLQGDYEDHGDEARVGSAAAEAVQVRSCPL